MREMSFAEENGCITATTEEYKGIVYKFHIDRLSGDLVQCEGWHEGGGKVVCRYSDFNTVDSSRFPHTVSLSLEGVGATASLQFVMSKLNFSDFTFSPRQVSASYDKMDVEKLLKSLGGI